MSVPQLVMPRRLRTILPKSSDSEEKPVPHCFWFQNIQSNTIENVNLCKSVLSKLFCLFEIRRSVFLVIVSTEIRSVTRFCQTKIGPLSFWIACDYVLQYNFVLAHVLEVMNTAVDFLPGANPSEKHDIIIRNDITTKAIQMNIQSTGVTEEELLYNLLGETRAKKTAMGRKGNITYNRKQHKPTRIQKTKWQNSSISTNTLRLSSLIEQDTSKTTHEQISRKQRHSFMQFTSQHWGTSFDESDFTHN